MARSTKCATWISCHGLAAAAIWLTIFLCQPLTPVVVAQAAPSHQATTDPIAGVVRRARSPIYALDIGMMIGTVATGDLVMAAARSRDGLWLQITTHDGMTGWLAQDALIIVRPERLPATDTPAITPAPEPLVSTVTPAVSAARPVGIGRSEVTATGTMTVPSIQARVTVTDARLNVRSGPGVAYPVQAKLAPGSESTVIGQDESQAWLLVELADGAGEGWVSAAYLAVDGALDTVPTIAVPAVPMPTPAPAQTGTRAAGVGGNLVIQVSRGGPIYVYNLTNGSLYPLTTGFDPAISPDGTEVAFTRTGGENGLYVIDIDGSNERRVFAERPELYAPKWSPDGTQLLFVRGDETIQCYVLPDRRCMVLGWILANRPFTDVGLLEQKQERLHKLAIINVDGTGFTDLPGMESAAAPDWVGDGIVYQTKSGLQLIAPDATTEDASRLLYFDILKQYHQDPDWNPRGGPIVFQQREASHWEIYTINPDGSGRAALTRPATVLVDALPSNVAPAWSPDGRQIVFLSNRDGSNAAADWRVWTMNADGSNQRPLPISLPIEYGFAGEQVLDWGP